RACESWRAQCRRSVRGRTERACGSSSAPPILLRFPLHRRASRILHFKPIGRAAGTVGGVLALRHDTFKPHLAGVGADGRAVALNMLVEPDAGAGLGQHARKRSLADLKRITPQVVAVQLDNVEGVEDFHRAVFVLTRIPSAPPISLRIGGQSEELAM